MKPFSFFAVATLSAAVGLASVSAATIRVACQNNTGDAALINSAINGSAVGDEIVIDGPGGHALINQAINLLGDRTYRGNSRTGTVLTQAASANLVAVLASASFLTNSTTTGNPITVRQLTIDGNKANNTAATIGIVLRNHDCVVEDVRITNMAGDGIRVSNPSANGTALTSTQNYGRIEDCFISGSDGHGIYIRDSGNKCIGWDVLNNWISSSGVDSIHCDNGNNWTIDGNHLYGVSHHGIWMDRAYNASISDNYIESFGDDGITGTTYYGIGVGINAGPASTIAGNHVFNFGTAVSGVTYANIRVERVNSGDGVVNVYGNVIRGNSTTLTTQGLYYSKGSGTSLTVNYIGNQVSNVTTPRTVGTGVTLVSQNSGL